MAFSIPSTFDWLKHRLYCLRRIILRRDALYYINRNPAYMPVKNESGGVKTCPLCGFSIATYKTKQNWIVKACSAAELSQLMSDNRIEAWLNDSIKKQPNRAS